MVFRLQNAFEDTIRKMEAIMLYYVIMASKCLQ